MPLSNQLSYILKQINKYSPSHLVVGYSGGVDSSVILNICEKTNIPIIAIHINHNISSNSNSWQNHCQQVCTKSNIAFIHHKLKSSPKGESFEAWASNQRVSFFKRIMSNYNNPLLLLGHHLDDQAETFLLQAIRGAGLAGLSAMPKYKKLNHGAIFRPLLEISKLDIESYARENNISYIHDESNSDTKYKRNFIRHEVLPVLQKVNPSVSTTLSRSASICAKNNKILSIFFNRELDNILEDRQIILSKLNTLEIEIQEALLHFWFKREVDISLKANQISNITFALNNEASTGWKTSINSHVLKLEYGKLSINKPAYKKQISYNKEVIISWLKDYYSDRDLTNIIIRKRSPNDKCRYLGRAKQNKLKTLFQELKIPADERSKAKVIELDNQIIAIYPFFICH